MAKVIIFIGGVSALPNSGRPTGMFKQQVSGPLELGPEGFIGDQQADRRVHGGPEKAVHLYPASHYAKLAACFPEAAAQLIPGSLGENLSSADLDESSVRIGDIYRLGNARLQVCQPRNPCWKIDDRFDADGMAAYIAEQSLTGWYWRVVQPGLLQTDDALELEQSAGTAPPSLQPWRSGKPIAQPSANWSNSPPLLALPATGNVKSSTAQTGCANSQGKRYRPNRCFT